MTMLRSLAIGCARSVPSIRHLPERRTRCKRGWTSLEQGVAHANGETRAKALGALGLLEKDERVRRLAESKLGDGEPAVRAAARRRSASGLKTAGPALTRAVQDD